MINAPANSIIAKTGRIKTGTPGIQIMCIQ